MLQADNLGASALIRGREHGKLDQRLRRLASLRIGRRVLLVRLKDQGDRR
jgi:hypothetical protein